MSDPKQATGRAIETKEQTAAAIAAAPEAAPKPDAQPKPEAPTDDRMGLLNTNLGRYQKQLTDLESSLPEKPQFQQTDPLQAFASLGGVIGVFGSILSRQPLISALNAGAASMEALKKQDIATYSAKTQEWDTHFRHILETEKMQNTAVQAILNNDKIDAQERMGLLRAEMAAGNASARLALQSEANMYRFTGMQDKLTLHLEQLNNRRSEYVTNYYATLLKTIPADRQPEISQKFYELMANNPNATATDVAQLFAGAPGKAPAGAGVAAAEAENAQRIVSALKVKGGKTIIGGVEFTDKDLQKVMGQGFDPMSDARLGTLYAVYKKGVLSGLKAPEAGPAGLPPAKADIPSFASEAEADAAGAAGKIKPGTRITVGGVTGTWK